MFIHVKSVYNIDIALNLNEVLYAQPGNVGTTTVFLVGGTNITLAVDFAEFLTACGAK